MWFRKTSSRRQAIREDLAEMESLGERADSLAAARQGVRRNLTLIAAVFFLGALLTQFWPGEPLPYGEGEKAPVDLRAPVRFYVENPAETAQRRQAAHDMAPPVLVLTPTVADTIRGQLGKLKADAGDGNSAVPLARLRATFPGLTDGAIKALQADSPTSFESQLRVFMVSLRRVATVPDADYAILQQIKPHEPREVKLAESPKDQTLFSTPFDHVFPLGTAGAPPTTMKADARDAGLRAALAETADIFPDELVTPIVNYLFTILEPMYHYDPALTAANADREAAEVEPAGKPYAEGETIVPKGKTIEAQDYRALQEAQAAFRKHLLQNQPWGLWLSWFGRALVLLLVTGAGALYVARMTLIARRGWIKQAWAVSLLLLSMLAIAKLVVGISPQSLYWMGLSPTLLATIILVIAYNPRFALGMSALHGLLVTVTLGQGIDFYLPMLAGIAAFAFGLGEIRTRGKLIEVGFVASAALFGMVWAIGLARVAGWGGMWTTTGTGAEAWASATDLQWVRMQSLCAAGAGFFVAMFALAILPSIERIFHITTAMTLLELCDANKPLLQRLNQEAPGTFTHSLNVGQMAEAAGNAIGANGLLCRVGAYYHDVGKLSKPQYFIENQNPGHPNRHDRLSPAMSLLIIVGHVKDGIELAREYALPWVIHQFIAQHHGTTLVEYFYHAAKKRAGDGAEVSDTEFRYPGPKPQTREAAIVMICDGCESAVRAIDEPTAGRIESMVHQIVTKRLMDGQFSECDLTLRELGIIEETLTRTLAAIHHGRVAYPGGTEREDVVSQPA